MGHETVIHGVFLLLLCLITKKCSSQTILFGVFYDNAYQAILKTSSKELNTTSNTSIIRRDFSLNEFLYQIQNIGEKIAKAGSERSFLFTDASSLGKEIMKEVVNTRNEPVSKVRRIIIVDNAFSREVQITRQAHNVDELMQLLNKSYPGKQGVTVVVDDTEQGHHTLTRIVEKLTTTGRPILGLLVLGEKVTEKIIMALNTRESSIFLIDCPKLKTRQIMQKLEEMGLVGYNDMYGWLMTKRAVSSFTETCIVAAHYYSYIDPKPELLDKKYVFSMVKGCKTNGGMNLTIDCSQSFQKETVKEFDHETKSWIVANTSLLTKPRDFMKEYLQERYQNPHLPEIRVSISGSAPPWVYVKKLEQAVKYGVHCTRDGIFGNKQGNDSYQICAYGFAIDLLRILKKKLNFVVKIEVSRDGLYGTYHYDSGLTDGVVREIFEDQADIGLDLTETKGRAKALEFARPFSVTYLTMVYINRGNYGGSGVLGPFSKELWLTILGSILGIVIIVWIFERISPYSQYQMNKRSVESSETFDIDDSANYILGTYFTGEIIDKKPLTFSSHVSIILVSFVSILIISAYSGNLITYLVVLDETPLVTGLYDEKLVGKDATLKLGAIQGTFVIGFLESHTDERLRNLHNKLVTCNTAELCWTSLLKGQIDLLIFDHMTMQHQVSLDHTCSARMIRVEGIGYGFGIIFRKNWSWKRRINTAVTHMINSGEVDHVISKWFSKLQCKKASTFYSLDINRMKDIFILLAITVLVCFVAVLITNLLGWIFVAKRIQTSSQSSRKEQH